MTKRLLPLVWVTASVILSGCGQVMERLSGKNDQEASGLATGKCRGSDSSLTPNTSRNASAFFSPAEDSH
jgi:uncharacterized protein YceK